MLRSVAGWWDSLELWVVGLPFVLQVAVMIGVILPVGYVLATGLERVINAVFDRLHEIDSVYELQAEVPTYVEGGMPDTERRTAGALSGVGGNGAV
ncbi:MAG: hypothetical protein HOQ24_01080 [Mycobacteriaceae bacterium]|nr:hypothetical protein [Mycobacteriaceae bacterium]